MMLLYNDSARFTLIFGIRSNSALLKSVVSFFDNFLDSDVIPKIYMIWSTLSFLNFFSALPIKKANNIVASISLKSSYIRVTQKPIIIKANTDRRIPLNMVSSYCTHKLLETSLLLS